MSLPTGLYRIVNVDSEEDVALPDSNDRSNVVVHDGDDDDETNANLWNIIALNTNEPIKYHIQSLSHGNYVESREAPTDNVTLHGTTSRGDRSVWYINQTRNGQYTIASSPFGEYYWDLPHDDPLPVPPTGFDETSEESKKVVLVRSGDTSRRSLWRLISSSLPGISAAPAGILRSTSSATACYAPHRRSGVSTRRLELVPRNQVDTLPFGIRLMRDGVISDPRNSEWRDATDQLWIVATLRNALCTLPPVFRYQPGDWNIWPAISPYFSEILRRTPTFVHIMTGLIDLATMIPGPATIDFTRVPVIGLDVTESRVRVNTADWSDGTRCIAMFTFLILRALPEHS